MKKNIFYAVVLAAGLMSCTKDYTCECTNSTAGSTASTYTLVENTKSQAKANCVSSKWTNSKGETVTETCNLK